MSRFSQSLIHPLRRMNETDFYPIRGGKGAYLFDDDNRRYLDCTSAVWNMPLGYGNGEINAAIAGQLERIAFANPSENSIEATEVFCDSLIDFSGGNYRKAIVTCTGSESLDAVIKLARQYHQLAGQSAKVNFVSFDISYHGTVFGAMSASGIDQSITKFYEPKVPGFHKLPAPIPPFGAGADNREYLARHLETLRHYFDEHHGDLAGFIVEPILGSGGVFPIDPEYLREIALLCQSYGVLLIFDEIATGFGRGVSPFIFQKFGLKPDLVCLSKAINNGYLPLGAVLLGEAVVSRFVANNAYFEHFSTQNGNPLCCAAGLATLRILRRDYPEGVLQSLSESFSQSLGAALAGNHYVNAIRDCGLMVGVELVSSKNPPVLFRGDQVMDLCKKLRAKGVIVYPFMAFPYSSGFSLFPTYCMGPEDIGFLCQTLAKVLDRYLAT